jgi:hypothetical protein
MPIFPLLLVTQLYEKGGDNGLPAAEADNSFNCFLLYLNACAMEQGLNSQNTRKLLLAALS